MQRSILAKAPSFSVFQNTIHLETILLSKHLYFQSRIDYDEMRNFRREIFFRIPSCLGQLIPSYKYFVLTILFLINYFLKINTFSAQLLFRKSFFFRISNYSEYVLFRSGAFYGQLLFQKRNLFRGRYFLIKSLFLVVLRNQFHSIYTWKDFP